MSLAVAILTSSLNANPLTSPFSTVKVSAVEKTLKVNVEKTVGETVEVSIETIDGVTIHTNRIEKNEKWKRYDLRQLPIGKYRLVVVKNKAKMIQPFTLNFDAITINESEQEISMLPRIKLNDKKLEVRVFSSPSNSITMKIIDNFGITAYEETVQAKSLARFYDVSKLASGIYVVEINSGSDVEYSTIQL